MDKREKVINGLECCMKDDCDNCPYYDPEVDHDCDYFGKCLRGNMYRDALALLKAQETPTSESISSAIECLLHPQDADDSDMAKAIDTAVRAMRLLKAQEPITGETSDGYHTFNELYHHRAVLFSVIVANYPDRAWKSKKHHDGTMYDNMFIVGIDTPDGQATYHYDVDPYWDMFKCRVLDNAPEWDGHTPAQAIERIGKLKAQEPVEPKKKSFLVSGPDDYTSTPAMTVCGACDAWLLTVEPRAKYCPQCGRAVKWE